MTFFPCIIVGSSIIGYTLHAYYRQQKGQYTLHFCTEWLKEIFCVPSLKLLCGNSGRGGNVFLKQSLVRGVWVYYSWIPIWRRYNGLRIVLNNQRMNDPANMPSRGSVQFSAVPSGPALGFSVETLGPTFVKHLGVLQYYMCAKCLRGEQSLTLSRLRGCRMWVEGEMWQLNLPTNIYKSSNNKKYQQLSTNLPTI